MSCMNAFVHDLHHCTKLQLSTRCSCGVMTQTSHKFPEFQSGKSVRTGICTIETKFAHCSNKLCIFNCSKYRTSNVSSFGCVTILFNYIFTK